MPPTRARARAFARALRHAPDRLSHGRRRRRALQALAQRDYPYAFLFVCHGNICRSPYAEHAFARLLPPELAVETRVGSAGFITPGRPSPLEAVRSAARRGIDLSAHRSALFNGPDTPRNGLVFVMNEMQRAAVCRLIGIPPEDVLILGDLDPEPIDTREIRDPYGAEESVFDAAYERIDRCVVALADAITAGLELARP
jgi:protein-tyrosine phosphatase